MEITLPSDKLARIQELLKTWLPRKKARKKQILSLVGTLQHASKVVRPGRAFLSRMYSTAAKLCEMYFITRLNKAFRSDLFWWHAFLQSWNGLSILRHPSVSSHPEFHAQTDASGTWGCAAVLGSQWLQWQWPPEWYEIGIMAKELVPIIFTCIVWGPRLSRHHINFQCDNGNLVIAINKGSSKDKLVMHLLRSLSFFVAHFDIYITASHLRTWCNKCNGRSPLSWLHVSSLRSHSYPCTTSRNYILCGLQANFSSHARLDIPRFSSIVPTNSIMHLLKHLSLLCTYMAQMYPHAYAQYDHTIISVLLLL